MRYHYLISSGMYLNSAEKYSYSSCIKLGKDFSPLKFQIEEKGRVSCHFNLLHFKWLYICPHNCFLENTTNTKKFHFFQKQMKKRNTLLPNLIYRLGSS